MEQIQSNERIFKGIAVSGGIARGVIHVHGVREEAIPHRAITEAEIPGEIVRFEQALITTRHQILSILHQITEAIGTEDASIFEAHMLVLEDRALIEEVIKRLQTDKENVEAIFEKVAQKFAQTFAQIDDPYLRERSVDIADVTGRVLKNLMGREVDDLHHLPDECILLATHLSSSETALLKARPNFGVAMETGSPTSHPSILLRTKGIPSVVGLHDAIRHVNSGQQALLDGYNGLLIIEPSEETLWSYGELEVKRLSVATQLAGLRDLPAETLDGRKFVLSANIESIEETTAVRSHGARGVGLFRTEYIFLNRNTLPSEQEQYAAYRHVVEGLAPDPVVIRTVDLGRDKLPSEGSFGEELNPFLGWCSIRYCLEHVDMFKAQLRAILRASAHGNVHVMFPMISGAGEVRRAREILEEAKAELRQKGVAMASKIQVGAMIEIPSAALTADTIAREVDFFSIGTNDLIQYSLAVDRVNEKVAYLYDPTHPAVVKLIKHVVDAAHARKIWVGLCGEMAADPALTPLLVGLGLDELSANAISVPAIKKIIRSISVSDAREMADKALQCDDGKDIFAKTLAMARRAAPELF